MVRKILGLLVLFVWAGLACGGETAARLEADVRYLAGEIGERSLDRPEAREAARVHIEAAFRAAGLTPRRLPYAFPDSEIRGENLEAVIAGGGRADEVVVVGAHYDTVRGSPGADDNASGVAVLLELGRRWRDPNPNAPCG